MTESVIVQIVIAICGMILAAVGAYVIIKVSLAKVETTLIHHSEQIGEIKKTMIEHTDVTIHPTRDQIVSLGREISDFKLTMSETHERIEAKVDKLFDVILQTPQQRRKTREQYDDE